MNTCKFTTLKQHSAGNKYTPVQDGLVWNLTNAQGGLLIGNRGKVYEFISENTARSWLINNLSRLKNSTKPTSNEYILKLGQYYIDEPKDYLLAEIEAIEELNRGVWQPVEESTGESLTIEPWIRPSEWLDMPTPATSEQKFVGLKAVFDTDSELIALSAEGAYTVNWGDGSAPVNFASGAIASYKYNFSSILSDVKSNGSKQVIITVTPQDGQNLTNINLNLRHPSTPSYIAETHWLEVKASTPNMTGGMFILPQNNNVSAGALENVIWHNLNHTNINFHAWAANLRGLRNVEITKTSHVLTMTYMFSNCISLKTIPLFDTSSVVNMDNIFAYCQSLVTIPLLNTANVTNFNNAFNTCFSLVEIPLIDTSKATNLTGLFAGCVSLAKVPLLNTAAAVSMAGMFSTCQSLRELPLLNTQNVTNMQNMFSFCYALETIPLLNTAKVTNMQSMFEMFYVGSLKTIPLLNTENVTNMQSMFQGCRNLLSIPLLNTAKVNNMNNMLAYCVSLQSVPALNMGAVTQHTNMVRDCFSLSRFLPRPAGQSLYLAYSKLSAVALNEIYTNLPTVTGKKITVTGNYGAAASIKTIATNKGWTVVA